MKQKTIFRKLMAYACLSILFSSGCGKETPTQNDAITNRTVGAKEINPVIECIPCNVKNPYDQVGVQHNLLLGAVHDYCRETGDTTRKGKAAFLSGYVRETYHTNIKLSPYPKEEVKIIGDYRSVLATLPISAEAKKLMDRYPILLESLKDVSWAEYKKFKDGVIMLEQEIQSSKLSGKEKQLLLSFSSIMRHSGWYWFDKAISSEAYPVYPFRDGLAYPMGFFRKLGGVLACIAGDATTLAWHYVRNSPIDHAIAETAWMSEVCGYYTGWY